MRHVFSGSTGLRDSGNNLDLCLKIEILCNLKIQPIIMKANALNLIFSHVRFMANTKKKLSQMYVCFPGTHRYKDNWFKLLPPNLPEIHLEE